MGDFLQTKQSQTVMDPFLHWVQILEFSPAMATTPACCIWCKRVPYYLARGDRRAGGLEGWRAGGLERSQAVEGSFTSTNRFISIYPLKTYATFFFQ
jgi:hypothetical protein